MSDHAEEPAERAVGASKDPFAGPDWIGKYALGNGGSGRRRMSDGRRVRRRVQRRTGWLLLALGGLMVLTGVWLAVTGLMARHELNAMRTELNQLRQAISTGDITDAKVIAADLARHAHHAHALTTGPAWWVTSTVPGVGDPFRTARGISTTADALGSVTVPKLVDISAALDPSQLKLRNHKIDISSLVRVTPQLNSAVADARQQQRRLASLPRHTWLAPMNKGAIEVDAALGKLIGSLDTIDQAARAAPTLLGYTTPQRYFVAFQNEAETRGSGGLPGAFAIIVADQGTLSFTHFASDSELGGIDSGLDFGTAYDQAWNGFNPTKQYLNSGVDPDFRYAGQIWAAMWQKKSGERVNGALAVDPTSLSYFLAVTGPARLPDGSQITAKNIVALTQSTAYAKFDDQAKRKAYLLEIAKAAEQRILAGTGDAKGLYHAAGRAAGERRLLLWNEDKAIESFLSASTVGGAVADTAAPYVQPVVVNYGANKLDYYLKTSVRWEGKGCGSTRDVTVTITLSNTAPAGLSAYVAQRLDEPPYPVTRGDNRVLLYYVGTQGGFLARITVDGEAGTVTPGTAGHHPTYAALVELPRGQSRTLVLTLREPASSAGPVLVRQPLVRPALVSAHAETCG